MIELNILKCLFFLWFFFFLFLCPYESFVKLVNKTKVVK